MALLNRLRTNYQRELQTARVPDGLAHHFDAAVVDSVIEKTTRREVITLDMASFEAVEVVRVTPAGERPSSPLHDVVPKGGTYGYDIIAYVGCQTFLRGRKLEDLACELPGNIPYSSLYDMQQKFLFYFGQLHRQSAPLLRTHFEQRGSGSGTWLIDGTTEPETAMFFGIYEAHDNILLDAWKIPTENVDAIAPCLQEASERFGRPEEVLHDLSDAMTAACNRTWSDVPQRVCHFHLLRDIGEDLFAKLQASLRERLRQLKLQPRLKEQRKGQTEWFREHLEQPTVLARALRDGLSGVPPETLGHEVLMAFHQWILDYAHDGHRQGFPFDPYLLYFHRRIVRASASLDRLLRDESLRCRQTVQVLTNFAKLLHQYLADPTIVAGTQQYEKAFAVFSRLRLALRLTAHNDTPLHDRYEWTESEVNSIQQSLAALRDEFKQLQQEVLDKESQRSYEVVVTHLDRYWNYLFPSPGTHGTERTTNGIECYWGASKRHCRQRHGRKKLTRDFQSLPADFLLLGNLHNPVYVQIVLGDLSLLPMKLAQAGRTAGPWTHWRSLHHPLKIGHLSRRVIRSTNFIDNLVGVYDDFGSTDTTTPS